MPLVWAGSIVIRARKENRVKNDQTVQALITQINDFRSKAGKLLHYDWVPVPLVYTQVFIFSLIFVNDFDIHLVVIHLVVIRLVVIHLVICLVNHLAIHLIIYFVIHFVIHFVVQSVSHFVRHFVIFIFSQWQT